MSETIFNEMTNVDPNERIQVGSFRVDGQGHQNLKEVPIVETRFHLENVIENLCSKFIRSSLFEQNFLFDLKIFFFQVQNRSPLI